MRVGSPHEQEGRMPMYPFAPLACFCSCPHTSHSGAKGKGSRTSHTVSLPFPSLLFSSFFGNCRMERLPIPLPLIIPYTQQPAITLVSYQSFTIFGRICCLIEHVHVLGCIVHFLRNEQKDLSIVQNALHTPLHYKHKQTNKQAKRKEKKNKKQIVQMAIPPCCSIVHNVPRPTTSRVGWQKQTRGTKERSIAFILFLWLMAISLIIRSLTCS